MHCGRLGSARKDLQRFVRVIKLQLVLLRINRRERSHGKSVRRTIDGAQARLASRKVKEQKAEECGCIEERLELAFIRGKTSIVVPVDRPDSMSQEQWRARLLILPLNGATRHSTISASLCVHFVRREVLTSPYRRYLSWQLHRDMTFVGVQESCQVLILVANRGSRTWSFYKSTTWSG